MSKTLLQLSIIVLLAFIVAGCEDEVKPLSTNSSAIDRISVGDLTFTLQMLNMHGQPQAQFAEGEDFQFQFIIENSSNGEYQLPVPWDFPVANDEFFALYRTIESFFCHRRLVPNCFLP